MSKGKRQEIIEGQKFGELTVIKELATIYSPSRVPRRRILCECSCGNRKIIDAGRLTSQVNPVRSCGKCVPAVIDGRELYLLRRVYNSMKFRCYNPKSCSYKNYGARNITVCDEWLNNFDAFYRWSIENGYREGLTIDRIDNNGNYCPENCQWASRSTQQSNTRQNIYISNKEGLVKTAEQWSRIYNVSSRAIRYRLEKHGGCIEDIVKNYKKRASTGNHNHREIYVSDKNGNLKTLKEWSNILNIPYTTLRGRYYRRRGYIEDIILQSSQCNGFAHGVRDAVEGFDSHEFYLQGRGLSGKPLASGASHHAGSNPVVPTAV